MFFGSGLVEGGESPLVERLRCKCGVLRAHLHCCLDPHPNGSRRQPMSMLPAALGGHRAGWTLSRVGEALGTGLLTCARVSREAAWDRHVLVRLFYRRSQIVDKAIRLRLCPALALEQN